MTYEIGQQVTVVQDNTVYTAEVTEIVLEHEDFLQNVYIGAVNNGEISFVHMNSAPVEGGVPIITGTAGGFVDPHNFEFTWTGARPTAIAVDPFTVQPVREEGVDPIPVARPSRRAVRPAEGVDLHDWIVERSRRPGTVVEPAMEPVGAVDIPLVTASRTMGLTSNDYIPNNSRRRFVVFRLADVSRTVSPVLNPTTQEYEFLDEMGIRWINNVHYRDIRDLPETTRRLVTTPDVGGQMWMQYNYYISIVKKGMKGRSLRRKYEKMPEILNEKSYAGKEFIA